MAAPAVSVQSCHARVEFWERFRDEVRRQVRDVNDVAGELLWIFAEGADPRPWVSVAGTVSNGCRAACFFDSDGGLAITGLPEMAAGATELRWGASGALVITAGREYGPAELASRFLDELPYDDDCYANPGFERDSSPLD